MNAAWLIAAWISTIFQCVPVRKAWETVEGGHCIAQWSWFLGTAIPSLVIDFCILVMPMPILWRLQMNTSRKVWIMGVFLCGYWYVKPCFSPMYTTISIHLTEHFEQRYSSFHRAPGHTGQSWFESRVGPHLVHDSLYRVGAVRRTCVGHLGMPTQHLHLRQACL